MTDLRIGISTCPNDTFAFHALLNGDVEIPGVAAEFELHDVQELNRRLLAGDLDVAKASFFAALHLAGEIVVFRSGSALGFGVGPVLLASATGAAAESPRVLCPGEWTTAAMLYQLIHPGEGSVEHVVFSEVMPSLERGDADLGVCIHEGRFTYEKHGLSLVEDLGATWEFRTGMPLPLGGIVGRRQLGDDVLRAVQWGIRESLEHALAQRECALPTMRQHAQELDDAVIWSHVDLYVNEWTVDLGEVGTRALDRLATEAAKAGLLPGDATRLVVLPG